MQSKSTWTEKASERKKFQPEPERPEKKTSDREKRKIQTCTKIRCCWRFARLVAISRTSWLICLLPIFMDISKSIVLALQDMSYMAIGNQNRSYCNNQQHSWPSIILQPLSLYPSISSPLSPTLCFHLSLSLSPFLFEIILYSFIEPSSACFI